MTESPRPRPSLRDLLSQILRRLPLPPFRPTRPPVDEPVKPPVTPPDPSDLDAERLRAQVRVVRKAFPDDGVAAAGPEDTDRAEDDADAVYLYRPGHLLVREDDLALLDGFFRERDGRFEGELKRAGTPAPGVVLVEVPPRKDRRDDVLATLAELDEAYPERIDAREPIAQPDHIMFVTDKGRLCPAIEPERPRSKAPFPPLNPDESAGKGVRVSVVDTGWWKPAASHPATPWVSDVVADPDDEEVLVGSTIHEYAGHGTFVAGVVQCLAPGSRVEVEGVLTHGGAVYESEICEELDQALDESDMPQLISISAGTHTRRNLGLLGFEILMKSRLHEGVRTLVVAAAGNDESDQPFYPAAFPWVVGVGSVDPDNKVSDFSNFGDWVQVYARGRDLVNAFVVGTYTCHYPENAPGGVPDVRTFDGIARWSGTSFSTPVVTGLIAAHMSATDNHDDPRRAYEELLAAASPCPDPKAGGKPTLGPL